MSLCFVLLAASLENNFRGPFAVRLALPVLLVLGGITTRKLKGRPLTWVFFASGVVSLFLCAWSATRGAHDLLMILGHQGARISTQAQPTRANGDPDQLELALVNLLRNALEASGDTGRVEVRVGVQEGRPFIAVEDHGSGVRPEDVARIFEPFFTTRAKGTGLGLAIVKRVVQAHRGAVDVTRSAFGGACFTVFLPPLPDLNG